jgi:hypothetical protein
VRWRQTAWGIGIYPGQLTASRTVRDSSSRPRVQDYVQGITRIKNRKNYKLDEPPVEGSVSAEAVYSKDKPEEYRAPLVATDDYVVDLVTPAITLTDAGKAKVSTADSFLVYLSFVGTLAFQEFSQLFYADVRGATPGDAEQWASLFVGMILTSHDALIDAYNAAAVTYQAGDFVTRHLLDRINFQESTSDIAADAATVHLTFQATGRLEMSRVNPPEFGLIEQIVSPELITTKLPVDVKVKVE